MNFIIMSLRLISIPIGIIGVFTAVGLIGFPILMLAKDINSFADKLEKNNER